MSDDPSACRPLSVPEIELAAQLAGDRYALDLIHALTDSQKQIESLTATVEQLRGRVEIARDKAQAYEARIADLKWELGKLDQENRALRSREWEPSAGHWYVAYTDNGRTMARIAPAETIDRARLRVALQAAHDDACTAVDAAMERDGYCPTLRHHIDHPGPCTIIPAASTLVTAVLDVVAEAMQPNPDQVSNRALADELLTALLPAARRLRADDLDNKRDGFKLWGDDQRIETITLPCELLRRVMALAEDRGLDTGSPS